MKNKSFGFTLAEVLITLGIIGVVAAMTIPTLIKNYQKNTYVTQLKKAYTQFNQVLQMMAFDHGCTGDLRCTDLFAVGTTNKTLGDELVKYFKVAKNCDIIAAGNCTNNTYGMNFDGSSERYQFDEDFAGLYGFITADGVLFVTSNDSDNCADQGDSSGATGNLSQECGSLYVDVNGPQKGPNTYGRDIFWFIISNGKGPILYPRYGFDDVSRWNENNLCQIPDDVDGRDCTARLIEEGWQMNY